MDTHHASRSRALGRSGGVALVALAVSAFACSPAVLTRLVEAQRLGSALHVAFSRTTAAGDRAVMATDDETAAAAVDEARALMAAVDRHRTELEEVLQALTYQGDLRQLAAFKTRFEEYRRLTEDALTLVLENTNVKAQRLAFGPATEAADAFHAALDVALEAATPAEACRARELAWRAWASVLEIRALHPHHIAEPEDAKMSVMEARMTAAAGVARAAVDALGQSLPAASSQLRSAHAALDRFMALHGEIVDLSRRNSNVRALALSLGRRRVLAADAEAQLDALEKGLAQHDFTATR
jgi:hypothetical protein